MKWMGAVLLVWAFLAFGWLTMGTQVDGGLCPGRPLRVAAFGYRDRGSDPQLSDACRHDAIVAVLGAGFPFAGLLLGGVFALVYDPENDVALQQMGRRRGPLPPPPPR